MPGTTGETNAKREPRLIPRSRTLYLALARHRLKVSTGRTAEGRRRRVVKGETGGRFKGPAKANGQTRDRWLPTTTPTSPIARGERQRPYVREIPYVPIILSKEPAWLRKPIIAFLTKCHRCERGVRIKGPGDRTSSSRPLCQRGRTHLYGVWAACLRPRG